MYVTPSGDIACKIILYGPAESGRGTFLTSLHNHLNPSDVSPIHEIELDGEIAQAFIWKSGQTVDVQGHSLVITIATLSGRSRVAQSRRSLVEATDGIIFVTDTRRLQLDNNIDAMNDLMEHLRFHNLPAELPTVLAYNRQDDPDALSTRQLDPLLNHFSAPSIETVAIEGKGIDAAWMTMVSILTPEAEAALNDLPRGPEPTLGEEDNQGCLLSCHACGSMLEVDTAQVGDIFTCGSCGATLKVLHPETGMTGPLNPNETGPITQSGLRNKSSAGSNGAESKSYTLQSLPSPIHEPEALAVASATGPISAAPAFELSGFDLLKELDSSPLGQRYRLYEPAKNRKLRTFRIDPTVVASSGYRVQIEPYVRMAAKVRHHNIVTILGLRWQGNTPYLISEDVSNFESLTSILGRRRRLSPMQAMEIGLQVAIGLEEAARSGVIHGFLRPDIVLISPENHVMIDDIGIPKAHAHLIQALEGQSPSTEYYLAPEHLLVDAASDIRSDMFLLGALLFRMVTAEGLITGFNAVEALHRFSATGTTTMAEYGSMIPRDMMNLLGKLTAADRRDRFQHYGEAIEAMERVIGSLNRRAGGTGSAGNRTGPRRKSNNHNKRGTRIANKTGPISPSTTRTRSGTGQATRRATGHHTTRRTQHHEREDATSYRHRRKKSGISGAALVIISVLLVVLVGGIGYYAYLKNEETKRQIYLARAEERKQAEAEQQKQHSISPHTAAQRALATYEADPSDARLERAAQQAIAKLSGQSRIAMDQRLKNIKQQHDKAQNPAQTPTRPKNDAQAVTAIEPPTVEPVKVPNNQAKVERLSARQQEQLSALKREQRFAEALELATALLVPGEVLSFYESDIRDAYIRTKTLAEANVTTVDTIQEIDALLMPAVHHWKMNPDDPAWAQALIDQHVKRLGLSRPATTATPTSGPATSIATSPVNTTTPTSHLGYKLPEKSPSGFTLQELKADKKVNDILLKNPGQQGEITRALSQIPEGSEHFGTVTLRSELWNLGPEMLQKAIDGKKARLRVANPISGGQWDIVSADQQGMIIRNPTGSSMSVNWNGIQHDELSKVYKQFNRVSGLSGEHYASAAAIELTLGETTSAKLFARRARQSGYEKADELDNLITLQRDRDIMNLIEEGIAAGQQLDPFKLEETIQKLQGLELQDSPTINDAIAHFGKRRQEIMNGTGSAENGMDSLTFDSPNDRLAFNKRSGWMIANGSYSNTGQSGELRRDDLGNAESVRMNLSLKENTGNFRIDFRGVELIANTSEQKITLRAAGSTRQRELPFTFATNTIYTLQMQYNPQASEMEVGINRLPPEVIGLPKATSSLIVTPSEDAKVSLHEIDISRFGQAPAESISNEEILASQNALRSLGLIPYGATVKDADSTAILIPEGRHQSGLGIPLRDGDKGIRFKVHGSGQLMIRVGDQARGTEGQYITVDVPEEGNGQASISVILNGTMWELRAEYGDGNPVFLEQAITGKANNVVVLAEKSLVIESTPEAVR